MSNDRIDVTAVYLHGTLFSVQVYVKNSDGYVDKSITVYSKSGNVETQ